VSRKKEGLLKKIWFYPEVAFSVDRKYGDDTIVLLLDGTCCICPCPWDETGQNRVISKISYQ
jgi:hypothetical protein